MKKWGGLFFTVIILILLVYVLWGINFYEVYLLLEKANLIFVGLAILCTAMTFLVWNLRWMYILNPFFKVDFWFFLHVLLAGSFFNTVTPGAGIGGEPFRAHFLAKKYKKPSNKVLGYVVGDTFFRMVALIVFVVFSVLFVLVYVKISANLRLILEAILIFVFLSVGISLFLILKKLKFNIGAVFKKLYWFGFVKKRFESSDEFVKHLNKRIKGFAGIFRKVVKNKNNIVVGVILSFIFWIFNFLTAFFLFLAFGFHVNFLSVIVVFTLGSIIGSLSPAPGGMGVVEGSMTLLYSAMGITAPLAILVVFMQRIIYYFFSLFLGGISLIRLRILFGEGEKPFSLF